MSAVILELPAMPHKRALFALLLAACAHTTMPTVEKGELPPITQPAATPAASSSAARRFTVLMAGSRAGSQIVTTNGNETTVDFEYNDRGRGPKTRTVYTLDAHALPLAEETTGNDYLKQPIEEHLVTTNGVAAWKNTSDSGTGNAGAFYSSYYGPPEEAGLLVRAAVENGGSIAVLPGGTATVHKVAESSPHGIHVTAYEVGGLGFSPFEVLMDDDMQLFGSVGSWQSVIREGFETDADALVKEQDARAKARVSELAKKYTHIPAGNRIIVTNARVFDPQSLKVSEPTTIVVEGNRITSVGKETERNAAELIDAGGKFVMPGLWDMHQHLGDIDGMLDIAAGVTSSRDLGNDVDFITDLKKKIETGEAIGPRLVLAGLVDGPGPFQGPTKLLVSTEAEAKKTIDMLASRGFEGLKIYSSVKPELVPFMTSYAHSKGMRVSGHIPAGMTASQAIDAGYDEIQHVNMLFLNFMPDVKDTRTPARFTEVAKRGADLDFSSPEFRAFEKKMLDHHTVSDPTLTTFEGMFTGHAGEINPAYAMVAERFPTQTRRFFLGGNLPVPDGMEERYHASYAKMIAMVNELYHAGVRIVAGTDDLSGFALHRELELYAKSGIPNAEVLRIATLQPAQILKRDKDLGTIEKGKLADFIIVDGDPTKNISDIRKVVTVVKNGKIYNPRELYSEMGVQ
jgi:imidazolonepropionase-like amidohydrolase